MKNKYCRIVWNTNGWRKPSGTAAEAIDDDFEAAREALKVNPELAQKGKTKALESLAARHAGIGDSQFRLVYGLRQPRNGFERILLGLERNEIDESEAVALGKEDQQRPVDEEQVAALEQGLEDRINFYSKFIIATHTAVHHRGCDQEVLEVKASRYAQEMTRRLNVHKNHLDQLFDLFLECRVDNGRKPLAAGSLTAATAIELAINIMDRTRQYWAQCQMTAERSQTRPEYLYSTTAPELFQHQIQGDLPNPSVLMTYVREEAMFVKRKLRGMGKDKAVRPLHVQGGSASVHFAPEIVLQVMQTTASPPVQSSPVDTVPPKAVGETVENEGTQSDGNQSQSKEKPRRKVRLKNDGGEAKKAIRVRKEQKRNGRKQDSGSCEVHCFPRYRPLKPALCE